jgi:Kef-type K+ transport system membrane component KefB
MRAVFWFGDGDNRVSSPGSHPHEHGIERTSLGALTLVAGAFGDVAAWCLLAAVLASLNGEPTIVLRAVGGGIAYVLTVFVVVRPLFARLRTLVDKEQSLGGGVLTLVLFGVALGSWFTETIGIHSVFGAFVFGIAMPRGIFVNELKRTLQPLTTYIILPLFFVYSGLNTQIGLLATPSAWALAVLIVLVASVGKGVACWGAARASGFPQHDALAIGVLMNARGLMELIVLNIGLERGLITPTLFTMMVFMAITTTVASGPLFQLVYPRSGARRVAVRSA